MKPLITLIFAVTLAANTATVYHPQPGNAQSQPPGPTLPNSTVISITAADSGEVTTLQGYVSDFNKTAMGFCQIANTDLIVNIGCGPSGAKAMIVTLQKNGYTIQ